MAAGADLPHDLNTFVIEQALGMERGFWGSVARGATFRSLGRKRTPQGKSVIAANVDALDAAEQQVNAVHSAWRAGEETPFDAELDDMLRRWRALAEGDELVLEWAPTRRPARH
jgi:hypothetical protein